MAALNFKCLLNRNSSKNAKTLCNKVMMSETIKAENCPWVQIGKVYASLTVTGDKSWIPLVLLLSQRGQKCFTVYTGRHGDICNHVDSNGTPIGNLDKKHYDEDLQRLEHHEETLRGIDIELVNTANWLIKHSEELKKDTRKKIKQQRACIYAWCYSIFTFCEAPFQKMDKDFDAAKKILEIDASGDPKKPSKWGKRLGASYQAKLAAYNAAIDAKRLMTARLNEEIERYADKTIFSITGKNWLWA